MGFPIALMVAGVVSAPRIISDLNKNKPPQTIMSDLAPVLEAGLDICFPPSGTVMQIVLKLLGPSHPMTPQEEELWMQRMSISHER